MNLILLGAPGAGKGTLAATLVEKMGVPSVSTGNILREAIKNGTELGKQAKAFMDEGKLVPDQLVIDLLADRIAQPDCANGYILDGFPRTIPQAEALDKNASIDCALSLEVPDGVITKRMSGRRRDLPYRKLPAQGGGRVRCLRRPACHPRGRQARSGTGPPENLP